MTKDRLQKPFERVERRFEVMEDEYGKERNSGVPMAPPVGYTAQPSMIEIVRSQIRSEHLRLQAMQEGMETFEEADDFDVDDDYDPSTPYEEVFDPVDYEVRNRLRQSEFAASVEARLNEGRVKTGEKDGSPDDVNKGREIDSGGVVTGDDKRSSEGKGESPKP